MSRTKELKTSPEFNVNMFELFSLFSPNKKTKYTETLLRIMKKTPNIDEHCDEIKVFLSKQYNIQKSELDSIPNIQLVFFYRIVDGMFNSSDINTFQKFCEYNERGLIKQNDVYDEFIECDNLHPDPINYFLISPKDCIFDDDVILFHSHPAHCDLIGFSEWDLKNQQYFYLKMLVYSVNNNEFYYKSI